MCTTTYTDFSLSVDYDRTISQNKPKDILTPSTPLDSALKVVINLPLHHPLDILYSAYSYVTPLACVELLVQQQRLVR